MSSNLAVAAVDAAHARIHTANPCANDAALRRTVHERLAAAVGSPGVDEVCIRGLQHRLDMIGMLDGTLRGVEDKADNDDLSRLRDQARAARPHFRRLVLVVGERHFAEAVEQVSRWWGVWLASPAPDSSTGVVLTVEREALDNPRFNRLAQAKVLRNGELRALLTRYAIDLHGTNDSRNTLAQELPTNSRSRSWRRRSCTRLPVRRCDAAVPEHRE